MSLWPLARPDQATLSWKRRRRATKKMMDQERKREALQVEEEEVKCHHEQCTNKSTSCDRTNKMRATVRRPSQQKSRPLLGIVFILISPIYLLFSANWIINDHLGCPQVQALTSNEFQVLAQSGGQVELPCLVGRQLFCGEPYFIAWYKLNTSSRTWTRIESSSSSSPPASGLQLQEAPTSGADGSLSRPLNERASAVWSRGDTPTAGCTPKLAPNNPDSMASIISSSSNNNNRRQFDCAKLALKQVELADEGQYKCEITFSESLDFERCPVSTMSQLSVIARPNEPDVLLNGKLLAPGLAEQQLTYKENSQVRLECQSSGGKPAPRIEWLNLTRLEHSSAEDRFELQLMRSHWQIKGDQMQVTAKILPITLSRHEQRSRFVCVVLAAAKPSSGGPNSPPTQPIIGLGSSASPGLISDPTMPELRSANELAQILDQIPILASSARQLDSSPMLKWIKFNILAKPASVSLHILDLAANSLLRPVFQWPPPIGALAGGFGSGLGGQQQQANIAQANKPQQQQHQQQQPFFALQPNKLYAIQCLVEHSKPRSQVAWFNRTAPIELLEIVDKLQLDFFVDGEPATLSAHSLMQKFAQIQQQQQQNSTSSHKSIALTRYIEHLADGTFSTISTLYLPTNFHDNYEEIFCRVSNDAFQFEELVQVAPIISAKILVAYPPSAWLEAPAGSATKWTSGGGAQSVARISGELRAPLRLVCHVGANPLAQSSILQIDWLKDGRRISANGGGQPARQANQSVGGNGNTLRVQIEKANHLHMPGQLIGAGLDSQSGLMESGKNLRLHASSVLRISSLQKSDSASYSCQYKLIPTAAGPAALAGPQSQPPPPATQRITSGQANQTIQLSVIEAKRPIVRVSSSAKLLVYDKSSALNEQDGSSSSPKRLRLRKLRTSRAIVVMDLLDGLESSNAVQLNLRCDLSSFISSLMQHDQVGAQHKIVWFLDGQYLISSNNDNHLNLTLLKTAGNLQPDPIVKKLLDSNGGSVTCSHQSIDSITSGANFHSANAMRLLESSNQLELRFKVEAKLLQTTDLEAFDGLGPGLNEQQPQLLMPTIRSFNENELRAWPSRRLKLDCLARCEPICSISWHLNNQPITGHSIDQNEFQSKRVESQVNRTSWSTSNIRRFANSDALPSAFIMESSKIDKGDRTGSPISKFAWSSRSNYVLTDQNTISEDASKQLEEDNDLVQGNVRSRLQLTSNQLLHMLLQKQEQQPEKQGQLLVGCKLLPLQSFGSISKQQRNGASSNSMIISPHQLFVYAYIEPGIFFPSDNDLTPNQESSNDFTSDDFDDIAVSGNDLDGVTSDADSKSSDASYFSPTTSPSLDTTVRYLDSLQTRIVLEKEPRDLIISVWSQQEGKSISAIPSVAALSENQLIDLLDQRQSNSLALRCETGTGPPPFPAPTYRWSFSQQLNQSAGPALERVFSVNGAELNLRQAISELRSVELLSNRQKALELQQNGLSMFDLITNYLIGNYTCSASNSFGQQATTRLLQIEGRPMCKVSLVRQFLSDQNELYADLRCSIYSSSQMIETVWYRNNKQVFTGTSKSIDQNLFSSLGHISQSDLTVLVLNSRQESMLTDLMSQNEAANFKCLVRNSIGYSACELSQVDKQKLLGLLKQSPSQTPQPFLELSLNSNNGQAANYLQTTYPPPLSTRTTVQQQQNISPNLTPREASTMWHWLSWPQQRSDLVIAIGACASGLALIWLLVVTLSGKGANRSNASSSSSSSSSFGLFGRNRIVNNNNSNNYPTNRGKSTTIKRADELVNAGWQYSRPVEDNYHLSTAPIYSSPFGYQSSSSSSAAKVCSVNHYYGIAGAAPGGGGGGVRSRSGRDFERSEVGETSSLGSFTVIFEPFSR